MGKGTTLSPLANAFDLIDDAAHYLALHRTNDASSRPLHQPGTAIWLTRHPSSTVPALLESSFDQLTASAEPAVLRHILQVAQYFTRLRFLGWKMNPYLRQALIRRQLASRSAQILSLDAGVDALHRKRVHPQRGDSQIGGLGQTLHATEHKRIRVCAPHTDQTWSHAW